MTIETHVKHSFGNFIKGVLGVQDKLTVVGVRGDHTITDPDAEIETVVVRGGPDIARVRQATQQTRGSRCTIDHT